MTLPTYLPIDEAAQRTGWTVERLRALVETGTIMAGKLPDGDIIVAMEEGKVIETPAPPAETPAEPVNAQQQPEEARPSEERALPLAVAGDDINAQLAAIKREDFEHLEGQEIGLSEAARKFEVPYQFLQRWIKQGYVSVIRVEGRRKFLDLADVAYCVKVYLTRKPYKTRAPLLNRDKRPYLLRQPELARLRRLAKSKQ